MNDSRAIAAHLGHVELLVPHADASLRFFTDVLGMSVVAQKEQSLYLRGWRDYERYTLKLTESPTAGVGHVAFRTVDEQALHGAAGVLAEAGAGGRWSDGDEGQGPAYVFEDPEQHVVELYYETTPYTSTPETASVFNNQPARSPARGAAIERIDHVNLLSGDVRACREFAQRVLGCRLSEQLLVPDGTEIGAWLRVTSKSYDLTYTIDAAGRRNRLHHVAFRVETREEVLRAADLFVEHEVFIELGPAKHDIGQTFFMYAYEPSGNRVEVCSGGYLIFAPDWQPVVWTAQGGDRGQAWNTPVVPSFFAYGTPEPAGIG